MPVNKNAYLRYRIIDDCLNNRVKRYTRQMLVEVIQRKLDLQRFSVYSLDKDIKDLKEEFGAPIKNNPMDHSYYYSSEFSLNGFSLGEDEEAALRMSLSVLDALKNTKYVDSYRAVVQKLMAQTSYGSNREIIQFEKPTGTAGMHWLDTLIEAISEYRTIEIVYQPYGKASDNYIVSPYMLKEYRNRFYLIARLNASTDAEPIVIYGLDRIQDIRLSAERFMVTEGFDPKEYFKYSFGITRLKDRAPLELILKFNLKNMPYVLSNPLHATQEILEQTEDSLTIKITSFESDELNMQILSYGAGVEVLAPASYIEYIKQVAREVFSLYKLAE